MNPCFHCGSARVIATHAICEACARNPFITEKYRRYLAEVKNRRMFLDTFEDRTFASFPRLNSAVSWDFLTEYHRYYEDANEVTRMRIGRILNFIPRGRQTRILDVGFGYGHVLQKLAADGYTQLSGMDFSKVAVKYISTRIPHGDFFVGNVVSIPLNDESMDVVLVNEVMEHIPVRYTFQVYDEIRRITRREGSVIFSVPLGDNLETITFLCPHGELVNPNGHVREYTSEVLEMELEAARLVAVDKTLLYPPAQGRWIVPRMMSAISSLLNPTNLIVSARRGD